MDTSIEKGNDPERWEKLLAVLDEKLQLGLLDHLEKVASYHFESDILYLEPCNEENLDYLTNSPNIQQLSLLAQDAISVTEVQIKELREP